jgi:RNA polymerase sigma factor (sigma-70 family)
MHGDSLTRLYLRWGRLDDLLPYARRCVVNAAKDHWRQSSRRERRELRAARWQPQDGAIALDAQVVDRDQLIRALRRLPPGQRAVIVLRYWQQLPEPEIAAILGNRRGGAAARVRRPAAAPDQAGRRRARSAGCGPAQPCPADRGLRHQPGEGRG